MTNNEKLITMKKINVAVAGLGRIGKIHLKNLPQLPYLFSKGTARL